MEHQRPGILTLIKNAVFSSFEALGDMAIRDLAIMKREGELFFGLGLVITGLFHFRSDKFCDGNSVDYLSCTRPSAFHYYGGLEIALIVLGSFFITIWFLKWRREV
jgi:hypothetical protein